MIKWSEKALTVCVFCLLGLVIGCIAFQNALTPAWIDEQEKQYISDPNGALPFPIPRLWYTSIADAELVDKLIVFKHEQRQLLLDRAKEDDMAWSALIKGQSQEHLNNAYALRTELFTTSGTVGSLLIAGLGIYAGWMGFSKPSDVKEIERLKNNNQIEPTVKEV